MFEDPIPGSQPNHPAADSAATRSFWHVGGYLLLLLIWLFASSVLIRATSRALAGPLVVNGLTEKMVALEQLQDDINVVFLGSSRSARHINPLLLREAAAELGCDLRSYNMGLTGFSTSEADYVLRWMAARDIKIPWVVMESKGTDWLRYVSSNRLYEHLRPFDYKLLDIANNGFSQPPGPVQIHLSLLGSVLNVGLVHRYIELAETEANWSQLGRWGYRPLRWMMSGPYNLPGRQAKLQELLAENPDYITEKLEPFDQGTESMRRIAEILSQRVVTTSASRATFISPPGSDHAISFTGYHDFRVPGLAAPPYHIALALEKTPQLADAEYWFDIGHLTRAGAQIYTRYLADEMCALQKFEQEPAKP